MTIRWLGHACFLFTLENGLRILTDPFAPDTGYTLAPGSIQCDVVTISHDHSDHNYLECVDPACNAQVIRTSGKHVI